MRIGDTVIWNGRRYLLRGFDPMSVPSRIAEVEDTQTSESIRVRVDELEQVGDEEDEGS